MKDIIKKWIEIDVKVRPKALCLDSFSGETYCEVSSKTFHIVRGVTPAAFIMGPPGNTILIPLGIEAD